jgi:hypothetical protein
MQTVAIRKRFLDFADLLAAVQNLGAGGDDYELQEELIAQCRNEHRAFVATMPERSRFNCGICGVGYGNAILHFEDPAMPVVGTSTNFMWGTPAGSFADINRSELHGILAHGCPAPPAIAALLAVAEG